MATVLHNPLYAGIIRKIPDTITPIVESKRDYEFRKIIEGVDANPWGDTSLYTSDDLVLMWKSDFQLKNQVPGRKNPFLSNVLGPQYNLQADGSYQSNVLNMLTNSGFVGAVSGTPGTAPSGWTWGNSGGTLIVDGNSFAFSTNNSRHYVSRAIPVLANTQYCYTVSIWFNGLTRLDSVVSIDNRIPSGNVTIYLNDVFQPLSGHMPPAGLYSVRVIYSIGSTAGNIDFRVGCGINGNDTAYAIFSNPQLTEGPVARPYVKSPVGGTALGDVVDVIGGRKMLRTCGAVTNLLTSGRDDFRNWTTITRTNIIKEANYYRLSRSELNQSSVVLQTMLLTSGIAHTVSITAKSTGEGNLFGIRIQTTYPKRVDAVVDLSNGNIKSITSHTLPLPTVSVHPVGNGEYRISITGIPDDTIGAFIVGSASNETGTWEIGVSSALSVLVRDPQLTASAYPLPYTPPGTTMPASQATTTNGPWFSLPQYDDAETSDGLFKRDGVELNNFTPIDAATTTAWTPLRTRNNLSISDRHMIVLVVDAISGGSLNVYCQNATQVGVITAPGTYMYTSNPSGSHTNFAITPAHSNMVVKVSSISIQKLIPATKTNRVWAALDGEPDGVELWRTPTEFFGGSVSYNNGAITFSGGLSNQRAVITNAGIQYPARYSITFEVYDYVSGNVRLMLYGPANQVYVGSNIASNGYVRLSVEIPATTGSVANAIQFQTQQDNTVLKIRNISIQRIQPKPMTLAWRGVMGVGSVNLVGNTAAQNILSSSPSVLRPMYYQGHATTEASSAIIVSSDGTNFPTLAGVWQRNTGFIKLIQINSDGSQIRVGYFRIGIDSAITWRAWMSYDGSFNPDNAYKLLIGFLGTLPLWHDTIAIWDKQVDDATLLKEMLK